jgi:Major Facilitator Superfamily
MSLNPFSSFYICFYVADPLFLTEFSIEYSEKLMLHLACLQHLGSILFHHHHHPKKKTNMFYSYFELNQYPFSFYKTFSQEFNKSNKNFKKLDMSASLLSSYLSSSSLNKRRIPLLLLLFSISSCPILCIPIFFQDPLPLCPNLSSSTPSQCTFDCSSPIFDLENGPNSISADFGIICEQKSLKTLAITINFIGIFLGCACSSFILIDKKKRQQFLGILGGVLGASLILMTVTKSFDVVVALIGLASFCFMYINTYSYMLISENFSGALASFVTLMYSTFWAFTGIFYAIFAHFTKASWKPLCILCGILGLIGGILLFILKEKEYLNKNSNENSPEIEGNNSTEDEEKQKEEDQLRNDDESTRNMTKTNNFKEGKQGLIESLREAWTKPQIRTNFLVYAGFWSFYTICYCCILIELESVGGNLYFNIVLCSCIEILACVMAGWLGGKKEKVNIDNQKGLFDINKKHVQNNNGSTKLIKKLLSFLALFFGIFILAPSSLEGAGSSFFIFCLLAAKLNNDTLNLVTYLNLKQAFTAKYVGIWMLVSRFSSRFLGLFIPYLNLSVRNIGLHPFVFYGCVWALFRVCFSKVKEISNLKKENEIPLLSLNKTEQI